MARQSYSIIEIPSRYGRNGVSDGAIMFGSGKSCFLVSGSRIHGQSLTVDVQCSSQKDAYPTYEAAEKAFRMKSSSGRKTKRIYKCSECGCYHFTTVDSQTRKPHPYRRNEEKRLTELLTRDYRGYAGETDSKGFSMRRYRNTQSRIVPFI